MVYWHPYEWYFEPPIHAILNPHPWNIELPIHGILNILSMVYWTPYLWYFDPLSPELQISCVLAFFTLLKRVKTHVLSDQSVHIMHTYCCVSKLSKFGAYLYADNTVVH
jgi:hypothetical protein